MVSLNKNGQDDRAYFNVQTRPSVFPFVKTTSRYWLGLIGGGAHLLT